MNSSACRILVLPLLVSLLGGHLACAAATNSPQQRVRITENEDWVPLKLELDIRPGSALDFSAMRFTDAPAGKHGRVIARSDGQFAFEKMPNKAQRFYGINLCFGAHYVTKAEADRLAERLVRLGYNALRIHHYEGEMVRGQRSSTVPSPEKLESFDYLMAALIERGIYLTTDLYVSRPVPYKEVGIDREGNIPMDTFKILVPVHAGAYENWKAFARALLTHVNPYTHRSYAEEPALAWIAMINEGNFGNFFKDIRTIPEWKVAWNRWLAAKYPTRDNLAAGWKVQLSDQEDPARGTVEFPERLQGDGLRTRDCILFLSETERDMVLKMKTFLRDELGCKALVSNASSWTRFTTDQVARDVYDYVDDHFYVDHPQFLEGSWRLPSKCPNTSPLSEGAPGGRNITFTRLFDKPFTLTEYNYSGPGRFRGVGGILTGALGSLQGWGGIWRFAYSHNANSMFTPSRMGYFDVASDPLSQAAERASLCLFLREDLQTAPHSIAIAMTGQDLARPADKIPTLAPRWHWMAWVTRVGTDVIHGDTSERLPTAEANDGPGKTSAYTSVIPVGWQASPQQYNPKQVLAFDPYSVDDASLISSLASRKIVSGSNLPRPGEKFFRSETGEVTIDGPKNQLILDTKRTAGGFAPVGQTIHADTGGVRIRIEGTDATVWVSALDDKPITRSERLLVTHLTDLQNTNIEYKEPARQTLLAWGEMPHLVRAGKAEVAIRLTAPKQYRVWALSTSGGRIGELEVCEREGYLAFTADVAADRRVGARMLYEVARE